MVHRGARERIGGASVRPAFDKACETFGGLDIVVSNAGSAWQGKIGEVPEHVLRQSFEFNPTSPRSTLTVTSQSIGWCAPSEPDVNTLRLACVPN